MQDSQNDKEDTRNLHEDGVERLETESARVGCLRNRQNEFRNRESQEYSLEDSLLAVFAEVTERHKITSRNFPNPPAGFKISPTTPPSDSSSKAVA